MNSSIEELENNYWTEKKEYPTNLVKRCHEYRKIKIKDLEIHQIITLLIQNIGSEYLMPTVLKQMENNILEEDRHGSCFLYSIQYFNDEIFRTQPELIDKIIRLIELNKAQIENERGIKIYERTIAKIKIKRPTHNMS